MTTKRARFGWAVATMALYAVSAWGEHGVTRDQVDQSRDKPVDILTRGPVHEAFAKPVLLTPKPTTVVPKRPPAPIEEEPPEQKPDDDSAEWLPGYWSWDKDREDFLWVSGVWRIPPPSRRWVPGYWAERNERHQWIPGLWAASEQEALDYLPPPPESVERGPSSPAPSDEHAWVPGCWIWRSERYVWRPGFWTAHQVGWIWVPSHYVWTPGGYIYVKGYWDYPIARRGVLFAPVYFHEPVYLAAGFHFVPHVYLDTSLLTLHLFTRPYDVHYCFGDYYDVAHAEAGIYPWFVFHTRAGCYDPLFSYYHWHHHHHLHDGQWFARLKQHHHHLREHALSRPPGIYGAKAAVARPGTNGKIASRAIARSRRRSTKPNGLSQSSGMQPLTAEGRRHFKNRRTDWQKLRAIRSQTETRPSRSSKLDLNTRTPLAPRTLKLPGRTAKSSRNGVTKIRPNTRVGSRASQSVSNGRANTSRPQATSPRNAGTYRSGAANRSPHNSRKNPSLRRRPRSREPSLGRGRPTGGSRSPRRKK